MTPTDAQLTTDAILALEKGRVIEAIRIVREYSGLGLKEAKEVVDRYLAEHPELRERARPAQSSPAIALLVAGLLAGVALLAFLLVRAKP